jgi:hypothetical protein
MSKVNRTTDFVSARRAFPIIAFAASCLPVLSRVHADDINVTNRTEMPIAVAVSSEFSEGSDGLGDRGSLHYAVMRGWFPIPIGESRPIQFAGRQVCLHVQAGGKWLPFNRDRWEGQVKALFVNPTERFEYELFLHNNRDRNAVAASRWDIESRGGKPAPFVQLARPGDQGRLVNFVIEGPTYNEIVFVNQSFRTVKVVVRYQGLDGRWVTSKWTSIAPKRSAAVGRTRNSEIYYYGRSTKLEWAGADSEFVDQDNQRYGMRLWQLDARAWGPVAVPLAQ